MAKKAKVQYDIPEGTATYKRQLPCKITDEESQAKGSKAAKLQDQAEELQEQLNISLKDLRADIKQKRGEIRGLLKEIAAGTEDRDVVCYDDKDFRKGEIRTHRADSGEVVDRRAMTADERQETMFTDKKRNRRAKPDGVSAGDLPPGNGMAEEADSS